jgi:hypothetical protein
MRDVYLQDRMPAYLATKAKQGALPPSFVKLALESLAPVAGRKAFPKVTAPARRRAEAVGDVSKWGDRDTLDNPPA